MKYESKTVFMPDYFDSFRCKCGDCRTVCCGGWGITLSDTEYFRLLGVDCSDGLRRRLDCAFAPVSEGISGERYAMMQPSYDGRCRLIREDGLCGLQCELGEDVLPRVCRMYPRSYRLCPEPEAVCSSSCEGVAEILMRTEPLTYVKKEIPFPADLTEECGVSDGERELLFRGLEIFASEMPLCDCMRELADISGCKTDAANISAYGGISALYAALEASGERMEGISRSLSLLGADGYNEAQKKAYDAFEHIDTWYKNIISNHLFFSRFPYGKTGVYAFAPAAVLSALLHGAVISETATRGFERAVFADGAANLSRYTEHTAFDKNSVFAAKQAGLLDASVLLSLSLG